MQNIFTWLNKFYSTTSVRGRFRSFIRDTAPERLPHLPVDEPSPIHMHASLNGVNGERREERGRRRRRRRDHMKLEEKNGSKNIGWIGREGIGGSYQNTLHAYMRFSNNSKYIKSDASFFIFQISKMQAFPPSLGVGESRTVLCKRPASKHREAVNRRACKRESP